MSDQEQAANPEVSAVERSWAPRAPAGRVFSGLAEAYVAHLEVLLEAPTFRNSPRGFASQEMIGTSFVIEDSQRRLVAIPERNTNLVFNFAEALWYMAGRDDLEYLSYYAPGVSRFVMGASQLTGTAYGPRIFRFGTERIDQWSSVVQTLRDDPDSKRAVMQIFQPEELLVSANPDVACTLALQFMLRGGRLHAVGYMRANDAFRGIVSDVFSFTLLQELMARELGCELGSYTHMVGSLHLYDPDVGAARKTVEAARLQPRVLDSRMPAVPPGDPRAAIEHVMRLEEQLRRDTVRVDSAGLNALTGDGLPEYWQHVVVLLELYRRIRHDDTGADPQLIDSLPALYQQMMLNRFPALANRTPSAKVG